MKENVSKKKKTLPYKKSNLMDPSSLDKKDNVIVFPIICGIM